MDSFEAIRNDAARLYAEIERKTESTDNPMKVVSAAVSHLGLRLTYLQPGDPALKGAKAVFDDQGGDIFAAEEGSEAERALAIAHELGHARIHTGSAVCTAKDVDPSRSTEAAPVGLQRVEDYGARERRELQANVFGRELLLPRAVAKKLFVDDKLGAAQIAKARGLPEPLIRQQILDVVLLPPLAEEPVEEAAGQAVIEDDIQDRAAAHRNAPYLLEAGPGTGKTRTLVKRIVSLLNEGVDPASILVLTFSNRAAGELADRIARIAPDQAPKIWIGTFHAFGLDVVRRHYDLLGLTPDPGLFDRSDAIAVLEDILPTLPLRHYRNLWDPMLVLKDVLTAISRAKDEVANPGDYRAKAQAMKDAATGEEAAVVAEKALEVAEIYARYEAAKAERKSVDFGDLIMLPTLLIEENDAVRTTLQIRHRHVLVDEYQDVNRASVRLLKALAGDSKRLWAVGDARQSIYRFRGASSLNMANFKNEFAGATGDQLGVTYRSTEQVKKLIVGFAPAMAASEGMQPLKLRANRGNGPARPELRTFDKLDGEEAGIAAAVRELERGGVKLRDQAVLCRTNSRLNDIAAALEARGIPVLHLGSLFERDEVRDLLALLSLAVDPFGDALVRIATHPRYAVSMQDVRLALSALTASNGAAIERLKACASAEGISSGGKAGLTLLATDLADISQGDDPWSYLSSYLLDRTDLGRQAASVDSVPARMRNVAIWQFLNFLRDHSPAGSGSPVRRALDRVRQLVLLAEERDLRQVPAPALHIDAVRLMTVHGSKGLEFEAVHVPGLTQASFPSSYRGQRCPPPAGLIEGAGHLSVSDEAKRSHAMEEECLFFVAVSRARTHLRLYQTRLQNSGKNRPPSELLNKVPSALFDRNERPPTTPLPVDASTERTLEVRFPEGWAPSDRSIELYQKCPRRFFYTHVLGLKGARKTTAFARTHDCLYGIIEWLAEARIGGDPTLAQTEEQFERIWQEQGPTDHAFAADYRSLSRRLVKALVEAGAGRRFQKSEPLAIDFRNGRVIVEPNEMATRDGGTIVLRRVRTGYKTTDEYDGLEYTLYHLAGRKHFAGRFEVEAVHLTDGTREAAGKSTGLTDKKIENRRDEADRMLAGIASGSYPPKIDAFTCPRCPHFFICAAAPSGPLDLRK